jgi:hypothetical protein
MSAGVSNLGMGWDVTRNPSQNIMGEGDYAAQAAAQQAGYQQQLSALNRPQDPNDYLRSLIQGDAANWLAKYKADAAAIPGFVDDGTITLDSTINSWMANAGPLASQGKINQLDYLSPQTRDLYSNYAGTRIPGWEGYGRDGGYQAEQANFTDQANSILQQQQAAATQAQQAAAGRQQNQNLQQQAYGQQTGGGFSGGLLNPSYAQPFGNTLGFNGGMMGSGEAPAASTGLNPWMAPAGGSSPSTANSGAWGGPFSNKNPWSLG